MRKNLLIAIKVALLIWAGALFFLHSRHAFGQFPSSPSFFAQSLIGELSFGPHAYSFWAGHFLRTLGCLSFFLGLWALGRFFLVRWFAGEGKAVHRSVFYLGLGLGIWAYVTFFLIAFGLISPALLRWLFAFLCLFGCGTAALDCRRLWPRRNTPRPLMSGAECLAILGIAGGLALAFIGTTIPEISYDALVYHLAVPQDYLDAGRMIPTPYNHFGRLPLTASLIYFWGLALGGVSLAKLINFSIGLVLMLAIYSGGAELKDRRLGLYACLIFISTPLVLYLFWMTNCDLLAALFLFLSLLSLWRWGQAWPPRPAGLYLSGLFGGLALATKYTAAFGLIPPILLCAWLWWTEKRSLRLPQLLLYGALLIAPLAPWWARNYAFTGNPVSPYLSELFAEKDVDPELVAGRRRENSDGTPGFRWHRHLQKTWGDATRGAQDLAFNFVGPLFLGASLFIFAARETRWVRWGAYWFAAAYMLGLSFTYITRLLIACFVPLSLIVAQSLRAAASPLPYKRALILVFAAIAGANFYLFSRLVFLTDIQGLSVATGRVTAEEYLKRQRSFYPNPSYAAYQHVETLGLGPDERLLLAGEARSFYSPGLTLGNAPYNPPLLLSWASQAGSPQRLWEKLKSENVAAILDNRPERSRLDPKKYADKKTLKIVTALLRERFDMTYTDSWTAVFKRKAAAQAR